MMMALEVSVSVLRRLPFRHGLMAALLALGLGPAPAAAQDAADLLVRTTRLENQLRQLSGQIEQLQFENRRLTEQLRKFQEDVDFRLSERGGARSGRRRRRRRSRPPAQLRLALRPSPAASAVATPSTPGRSRAPPARRASSGR